MLTAARCITFATIGSLAAGCRAERAPAAPVTVLRYSSPMWYEELGRSFQPSPDGRRAIYGSGPLARLYDVRTGMVDSAAWRAGMTGVRFGTWEPNGTLVRAGVAGVDTGWFADSAGHLVKLPVPVDAYPRWSADGAHLAWFELGDSGFSIVRAGRSERVLTDGALNGLKWAPSDSALYATVLHANGLSALELITIGGKREIVHDSLDASPLFNSIAIAPNGRTAYLALAGDTVPDVRLRHDPEARHRTLGIYALDLRTRALREFARDSGDDCCVAVADGALWWTHNDPAPTVVVAPIGGGASRVVAEHGFWPRWSPDGRRIAFTRAYYRMSDYGLDMDGWVVGVDSNGAVSQPGKPWITGYGEDMGPVWSPDGKWVAFHSHRSRDPVPTYFSPGRTDDIWLELASGGPEIRLTDFGYEVGPPDWSPDGRRLLFDSWDRHGVPRFAVPWITTIDPRTGRALGSKRMPLPAGVRGITGEAWSPKGDEIAFVERIDDGNRALWLSRSDGGNARKLVEFVSYTIGGVAFTPDGQRVLYSAMAGGHMQLFAIARAGGSAQQITSDSAANLMHPSVSPDGRFIAASRIPWRKELRRMPLPRPSAN
jgi:hypothetical protein